MSKLSAYQKLKQENQQLRNDLYTVIMHPDSTEASIIKARVVIQAQTEQAVFAGSITNNPNTFNGLIHQISKQA